jgi:hypothetical protein
LDSDRRKKEISEIAATITAEGIYESLDGRIVTDLNESIDVYEPKKICEVKQQAITVHYRLAGNLSA